MYTLDFISDCVSPSPHFSAFSFFGTNRFRVGKNSMEDMVYIQVLKLSLLYIFQMKPLICQYHVSVCFYQHLSEPSPLIFVHFHGLDQTYSEQKKNLLKILSIYGFFELRILFFFQMKPLICQYHVSLSFYQHLSEPYPLIFVHFHFLDQAYFEQSKNLWKILSIYGF